MADNSQTLVIVELYVDQFSDISTDENTLMNSSVTDSHNLHVFRSDHSQQNMQGSFDTKSTQKQVVST